MWRNSAFTTSRWWRPSIVLIALCLTVCNVGGSQIAPQRVLILNEAGTAWPGINLIDQGIRAALETSPRPLEFYREYLEAILFPDPTDQQRFREFYIRKYKDRQPDVIITVGPSALKFMAETHSTAFPGVPIVFCFPSFVPGKHTLDSDFTGVENELAVSETIDTALRLQPRTRHIIIFEGTSLNDMGFNGAIEDKLRMYDRKFEISYLTNLTMPDLLERVKKLPENTIVLSGSFTRDEAGSSFTGGKASAMVTAAANAPVFTFLDSNFDHGEVGGKISSLREQGTRAGELALRILKGEKPQNIARLSSGTIFMFDWRTLKRWGIKEADLPFGSILLNRQPNLWELYRRYVLAGIVIVLAQAAAIVGLLWQRRRRRKIETELIRSEEKFSKSFRQSPLAITILSATQGCYVDVNEAFEIMTGWKREDVIGKSPLEINLWVSPSQQIAFVKQVIEQGSVRGMEINFRRKDGEIRTCLGSAELIYVNGEPCSLSVKADITERKQAEEAMSGFSRSLIEAQESERSRIARELHDDINQRLAIVSISLKTAKDGLVSSEVKTRRILEEATMRISELESDVQALSHRLHSSKLEYLGLSVATAGFCRELSERQNVKIDLHCKNIPEDLPWDIALCVFRVLQEALHNAMKYSGVEKFEVSLTSEANVLELRVSDSGVGFDAKQINYRSGLGLTSMRERLKLVNGALSIETSPGNGATVLARIPLDGDQARASAAA